MALTAQQRADVRFYAGWSARFHQFDSQLEQAMNALETEPEHELQITNPIDGTPPGLLALMADIDSRLSGTYGRLKASKVGSIELNAGEISQLRSEGRRLSGRLCSILGIPRRIDVFGSGGSGGSFVGK